MPVKTPLGAQLDLGTQPGCKAPSDILVELVKMHGLTLGEFYPFSNGQKLAAIVGLKKTMIYICSPLNENNNNIHHFVVSTIYNITGCSSRLYKTAISHVLFLYVF